MNFGDSSHKTVEMPDCFRSLGPKRAPPVGIGLTDVIFKKVCLIKFNSRQTSLTLYDGNSNTAPLIYKYCYGIHLSGVFPISHISSGNEVFIHYQPNTVTRFSLEYHPYSKSYSKYSLILS